MAHWKDHAEDCHRELGNHWVVVHLWLDELAKYYWPSKEHRIFRHNIEGVEEVKKMWGSQAAEAAVIHIMRDEGELISKEAIAKKYDDFKKENSKSLDLII